MKPTSATLQKARQLGLTPKQAHKRKALLRRLTIKGLTNRSPE